MLEQIHGERVAQNVLGDAFVFQLGTARAGDGRMFGEQIFDGITA